MCDQIRKQGGMRHDEIQQGDDFSTLGRYRDCVCVLSRMACRDTGCSRDDLDDTWRLGRAELRLMAWSTTAKTERIDGSAAVRLLHPLTYKSKAGKKYTVLPGFISDGASIPPLFWQLAGPPFGGEYTEAAILHDAMCQSGLYSPAACDRLMKESMISGGTPQPTVNAIMLGLGISRLWRRKRSADPTSGRYLEVSS